MRSLIIDGVDTFAEWGLVLSSKELNPPAPKFYTIDVPGGNGQINLTSALSGDTVYNNREQEFVFTLINQNESFEEKKTKVSNYLHGKEFDYKLSWDSEYTYHGWFAVDKYGTDGILKKITITVDADPYKFRKQQVYRVNAVGGELLRLSSGRKKVLPTFETGQELHVIYKGEDYTLPAGTWRLNDVIFSEGANEIYVSSMKVRHTTWGELKGLYTWCPGYGWTAGTAKNYIDYENKKYIQQVGVVDLGTLPWVYERGHLRSNAVPGNATTGGWNKAGNLTCSIYQNVSPTALFNNPVDKTIAFHDSSQGYVYVYDSAYTNGTEFKQAMQGVKLYYEYETPLVMDISNRMYGMKQVSSGGQSVVWNQMEDLVNNLQTNFTIQSQSGGIVTVKHDSGNAYKHVSGRSGRNTEVANNHLYFCSVKAKSDVEIASGSQFRFIVGNGGYMDNWQSATFVPTASWKTFEAIRKTEFSNTEVPHTEAYVQGYPYTDTAPSVSFKDFIIIDLTQMFGAGKEPTDLNDPRIQAIKSYALSNPGYNAGTEMNVEFIDNSTGRTWGDIKQQPAFKWYKSTGLATQTAKPSTWGYLETKTWNELGQTSFRELSITLENVDIATIEDVYISYEWGDL